MHGKLEWYQRIDRYCRENNISEVRQVGDAGFFWPPDDDRCPIIKHFNTRNEGNPLWLAILGNHDNYNKFTKLKGSNHHSVSYAKDLIVLGRNFHYEHSLYLGGAVSSDAGPSTGIGPDGRVRNYKGRVEGKSWWRGEAPTHDELQTFCDLLETNKPRYVFTHDGPQFAHHARGSEINPLSGLRTDEIARAFETIWKISDHKPERWFFGHHHELTTVVEGPTSFHCCGLHGQGFVLDEEANTCKPVQVK